MKKYILAFTLAILLSTNVTYALTPQEEYQNALMSLISLLQQQVATLMDQLKQVQSSQLSIETKLDKAVEQTLPIQTFGATTPTQTMQDKSDLLIEVIKTAENGQENMPYGQYNFIVSVLDKNGEYLKDQLVTMSANESLFKGVTEDYEKLTSRNSGVDWRGNMSKDWKTGDFNYIPSTKGIKTITFTSGTLSKNYQLEVK